MEIFPQSNGTSLMLTENPENRWKSDDKLLEECRRLVRVLTKKTETLYRECRHDRDKVTHIRSMVADLAALRVLVIRPGDDPVFLQSPEILTDARGIIYESVRSCELNRICDK